jgi:hypothetical protein
MVSFLASVTTLGPRYTMRQAMPKGTPKRDVNDAPGLDGGLIGDNVEVRLS